jgi:hypothetical protein
MPYRLLNDGENIEPGDEVLLDDAETWEILPTGNGDTVGETWMIGVAWNRSVFQPVRRKIERRP